MSISCLLLVLEVCSGTPTYRKSRAGNLLMWLYLTLGHSFKVKQGQPNLKVLITHLLLLSRGLQCENNFLCQLTCQSAGIMSSLCGVGVRVRVRVRVNNFSSKTTRPRDVLFFLKDTLSIEDEKLFKACKSVCSSVC